MGRKSGDLLERVFGYFIFGLIFVVLVTVAIPEGVNNPREVPGGESASSEGRVISVQGLDVLDVKSLNPLSLIEWGTIQEGENKSYEIIIENIWPYILENITISVNNVDPPLLEGFLILTSGSFQTSLKVNERSQLSLILTVKEGVPKGVNFFTFDIFFIGSWNDDNSLKN